MTVIIMLFFCTLGLVATTPGPTTALPGGGCPRGWSGYGSHCYLIEKDMVEWNLAQSYCHEIGAELASVHSIGEMQHLTAQLAERKIIFLYENTFFMVQC